METGEVQFAVREGAQPRGATGTTAGHDGDYSGRETVFGAVVWVSFTSARNR